MDILGEVCFFISISHCNISSQRYVLDKTQELLHEKGDKNPVFYLSEKQIKGYQRRMEDVKYRYHDNDHLSVLRRAEENPDVIRDFQFDGESAETLKLGMSLIAKPKNLESLQ